MSLLSLINTNIIIDFNSTKPGNPGNKFQINQTTQKDFVVLVPLAPPVPLMPKENCIGC